MTESALKWDGTARGFLRWYGSIFAAVIGVMALVIVAMTPLAMWTGSVERSPAGALEFAVTMGSAMGMVMGGVILLLLPQMVAGWRRCAAYDAIGIIAIFFGWTGIGFVIAMVWAFRGRKVAGSDA